jgi:hypothetical protein
MPGLLDDMKTQVAGDPALPAMLDALDNFGDADRFHYLDVLTGATLTDEAPQTLWGEMTTAIAVGDPALLADISSTDTYERGRRRLDEEITGSLTRWWELYVAAWGTGAVGNEAKRYAPGAGTPVNAKKLTLVRAPPEQSGHQPQPPRWPPPIYPSATLGLVTPTQARGLGRRP